MKVLHDELVKPIVRPATREAWYRGRRLVSLDSRGRQIMRGLKRKMSNYRLRPSTCRHPVAYAFVQLLM